MGTKKASYKDFKQGKFKVGKKIKKSTTTTDINVQSVRLNVLDQHLDDEITDPVTIRGIGLSTLCKRSRFTTHYKQRKDALSLINELVSSRPADLDSRWAEVLEAGATALADANHVVREQASITTQAALRACPSSVLSASSFLLDAQLHAGLTHVNRRVQLVVLDVVDVLLKTHPSERLKLARLVAPLVSLAMLVDPPEPRAIELLSHLCTGREENGVAGPMWRQDRPDLPELSLEDIRTDRTVTPATALFDALKMDALLSHARIAMADGKSARVDQLVSLGARAIGAKLSAAVAAQAVCAITGQSCDRPSVAEADTFLGAMTGVGDLGRQARQAVDTVRRLRAKINV
ncbi:hypothetical protein J8273_3949 [Carpediemonas membranifera]|uniref:Uncharacterized protein n=1 Tax=Carpediemonas membranifera TaxID=201153 RepID=A0A8J6EA75_9EUKA|nr:hypothetical protein J8273_3949 [Carpediemonas membranifera]|eukprot:KAG9394315.1 hypothetical protein J8273_3949 [Carpediemonas membranifera]